VFQYNFDFFSILSIGMIMLTFLISRPLMLILAGRDFGASGPVLNILIIATAGIFFGTLFTYLLVAIGAQKQMIKYFLIVAIVGLSGYFVFIPRYSYWGAAYMTLLVEWLLVLFSYLVVKKNLPLKINFKTLGKSLLAGLVAFLPFVFINDLSVIIKFILATFIYILVLYLTKAVSRNNLRQVFIGK